MTLSPACDLSFSGKLAWCSSWLRRTADSRSVPKGFSMTRRRQPPFVSLRPYSFATSGVKSRMSRPRFSNRLSEPDGDFSSSSVASSVNLLRE